MDQETKNEFENLARMVQSGFEETATKMGSGFREIREEMDQRFRGVSNQIDALHSEFVEVKAVLPPLVRSVAQLEIDMITLRERVDRIEKKVGLSAQ